MTESKKSLQAKIHKLFFKALGIEQGRWITHQKSITACSFHSLYVSSLLLFRVLVQIILARTKQPVKLVLQTEDTGVCVLLVSRAITVKVVINVFAAFYFEAIQ